MRISTNTIYDTGTNQIGTLQSAMAKTQMQLSTGRQNLTAADNPIAAARALEVTQSQSINTQFDTNRANARGSLSQVDLALGNVTGLIQDVQTLTLNGGDAALSAADRESLAVELTGKLNDLLGVANTSDGSGGYLFAGYRATTLPFAQTAAGATYQGDQGQRLLQVATSRQIPISDSGSSVFENNITGNGSFETTASPANYGRGGSGIVSGGSVVNAAQLTGHSYSIDFSVAAGVTTYTVTDTTLGQVITPAPVPFQSGQQIAFDGVTFAVAGAPADQDQFTLAPSQNQSLFTTLTNLISTLRAPASGAAGQASLTNNLNQANVNLNSALDNVLSVRASVGSRLKELDSLDSSGSDLDIQYSTTLSQLQDLDTVKAISLYTQQQFTLDAAQKSFKSLTALSLFNYIS